MSKETTPECSHEVAGKYLVCRGTPGHYTGFLACEDCLTEADFKKHPGWKERIAKREKQAEQFAKNLGRKEDAPCPNPEPNVQAIAVTQCS